MLVILTLAAAVAAGADGSQPPAPAAQSASAPVSAAAPATPDGDKVVCRREMLTGSHFKTRICAKQSEWDQTSEKAQKFMRSSDYHPGAVIPNAFGPKGG